MSSSLFRTAALEAQQIKWLGSIVLIRPLSFATMTVAAAAMATLLIGFLCIGTYTKRTTVGGHLAPDTGVLKVFAPQAGVIIEKGVQEGQVVKKGDILYLVSSERQASNTDGIQAAISRQVMLRQHSLQEELRQTQKLQRDQENALRKRVAGLEAENENLILQLEGQRSRVELARTAVQRATDLLSRGYISAEVAQQKQADLLDQQNRLQALERDRIAVERQLLSERNDLSSLPLQQRNQLAQVERLLTSTNQELTESEGKRRIAVIAPEEGIATAITAEVGQNVDSSKPLMTIVPDGAILQAQLYAPSRAIGFVRQGDLVLLRYHAYPYQKFGHARGKVTAISRTGMSPADIAGDVANSEPLYRITVALSSQTIMAYGDPQPLQPGMLVDADILQEKRKLYEWVLEPLFSLTGKL